MDFWNFLLIIKSAQKQVLFFFLSYSTVFRANLSDKRNFSDDIEIGAVEKWVGWQSESFQVIENVQNSQNEEHCARFRNVPNRDQLTLS